MTEKLIKTALNPNQSINPKKGHIAGSHRALNKGHLSCSKIHLPPPKRYILQVLVSLFDLHTYVVGTQKHHLTDMILLSTCNMGFNWFMRKILWGKGFCRPLSTNVSFCSAYLSMKCSMWAIVITFCPSCLVNNCLVYLMFLQQTTYENILGIQEIAHNYYNIFGSAQ